MDTNAIWNTITDILAELWLFIVTIESIDLSLVFIGLGFALIPTFYFVRRWWIQRDIMIREIERMRVLEQITAQIGYMPVTVPVNQPDMMQRGCLAGLSSAVILLVVVIAFIGIVFVLPNLR